MVGATLGKVGYVKACDLPALLNQNMWVIRSKNKEATHPRFLNYWFRWKVEETLQWASGSARGFVRRDDYRSLPFPEVNYGDQRAIAGVLGALDDKIEQNRRTARPLERLARAIFRSWFVDFEPVKAKAAGATAFPSMPQQVFDALPTRFVDSDIGPVPEGWEVKALDTIAHIQGGKQLPTEDCKPVGSFPVYGANGIMGYAYRATHEGFVIAFGRVGAYCGAIHWTYGGAWINNNASSVVPRRWPEFVLQAMLETDFEGMRTGSAQPFIRNSSLASLQIVFPPDNVLNSFSDIARPLRIIEQASGKESRKLAEMRDYLLPRLLSGSVRVEVANG